MAESNKDGQEILRSQRVETVSPSAIDIRNGETVVFDSSTHDEVIFGRSPQLFTRMTK